MIELLSIRFVHTPSVLDGSVRTALPVRKNSEREIAYPEWQAGITATAADSPAVYTIPDLTNHTVTIRVRLRSNDPQIRNVYVRAVNAAPLDENRGCRAIVSLFLGRRVDPADINVNILGDIAEREVSFGPGRESDELEFTVSRSDVNFIAAGKTTWIWQYRYSLMESWNNFMQTEHNIYSILSAPTAPWVISTTDEISRHFLLWTDVLDHACWWARGQRSIENAAGAITDQLYARGNMNILRYETTSGDPRFTDLSSHRFSLQRFLNVLSGAAARPGRVNCDDIACALVVFANALGCDLWVVKIGGTSEDFYINPVRVIGVAEWNFVTESRRPPISWDYHTVAMTGGGTFEDNVFDGLIQLNGNRAPTLAPYTPMLAKNFPFGEVGDTIPNSYRYRLAASDTRSQRLCSPCPDEKYRPVIWWIS